MAETGTQRIPEIDKHDPLEVKLEPWPIDKSLILSGEPKALGILLHRSADGKTADGVWECSPGSFSWNYTWDETIYVVKGRATIKGEGGNPVHIKAGDIIHFSHGLRAEWKVTEMVRKVFFLRSDQQLEL